MVRAWIAVVLAACGGRAPPPPAPPGPPAAVESNRAEAEPWTPPPQPRKVVGRGPLGAVRNGEILVEDELGPRSLSSVDVVSAKRSDLWHPCVRDAVAHRERAVRDLLGDALTAYLVACDRTTGTVAFGSSARRTAMQRSYLGISGVVTKAVARLEIAVVRHGEVLPERITILAGSTRWTSIDLDAVWRPSEESSVATLPFTRGLAGVIRIVLDADEPILRFESAAGSEDIVITLDMKQDLRVLAELSDALNP